MNLEEFKAKKKKQKKREEESRLSSIQDKFNSGKSLTLSEFASLKGKEYTYTVPEMGNESNEKWFKSGAFSDGYQFGDLTKTVLGTVGDASTNIVKGAGNLVEGVTDLGVYGAAGIADFLGADNFAEDARNLAKKNSVNDALGGLESYFDKNSVLDTKADSISQGLGYVGGILLGGKLGVLAGLGTAGTTALTTGLTFGSGMGGGMSEAYQSNATDEDALQYGLIKGAVEAGSELLFGGLGKTVKAAGLSKGLTSVDDVLAKKLSNKVTNQIAKNFVEYGVKASAEGLEEVIAGVGTAWAKYKTYMSDEEFSKLLEDEQLLDQFVAGAVTSSIAQSGLVPGMKQGSVMEANKSGRDFITGYTQNEQAVIDKVVENRIKEAEEGGNKLSNKEKDKIIEEVENNLKKGYIDIDSIEEALGGDSYNSYKTLSDEMDEYTSLNKIKTMELTGEQTDRLAELKKKNDTASYESEKARLKQELSKNVSDMTVNDTYLRESYNEKARRGQKYTADVSKYDVKHQETIQRAIDSGILNNTNRTHEFVDMIAKVSADKGVSFNFTDNQKLKESGFALEGKIINGYVENGEITLNLNSSEVNSKVVGHEITHVLEGTEYYDQLKETVIKYAKSKGEYTSRVKSLIERYRGVDDADIEEELTADLVGEYLFTDEQFISNLSAEQPNIFKKIYEEIKYLVKIATAGSKEARQLEQVKRTFDKAYKQSTNTLSNDAKNDTKKIKFSITKEMTEEEITKEIEKMTIKPAKYNEEALKKYDNLKELESAIKSEAEKIIKPIAEEMGVFTDYKNHEIELKLNFSKNSMSESMHQQTKRNQDFSSFEKMLSCFDEVVANAKIINVHDDKYKGTIREDRNIKNVYVFLSAYRDGEYIVPVEFNVKELTNSNKIYMSVTLTKIKEADIVALPSELTEGERASLLLNINVAQMLKFVNSSEGDFFKYIPNALLNSDQQASKMEALKEEAEKIAALKSNNRRYSLSQDTEGRTLTKEQQEYFKDSKVIDENGNLKVMYHGTPNGEFTVFKNGTYFTESKDYADRYQSPSASSISSGKVASSPKTFEVYLNIKKPFDINDAEAREIYINDYIKGGNAIGINPYLSDAEYEKIDAIDWTEGEDLRDFLIDEGYDYDGLILDEGGDGGYGDEVIYRGKSYVVFNANQVKAVDNSTPTDNSDINMSLSNADEDIAPIAPGQTRLRDMLFEAPTAEDIATSQEGVRNTSIKEQIRNNLNKLSKMNSVAEFTTLDDMEQWSKSDIVKWTLEQLESTGYEIEREGYGKIVFDKKQIKRSMDYMDMNDMEAYVHTLMPEVLKKGIVIENRSNHKGREYGTTTFAAPVTVNGRTGYMAVVVRKTTKNKYKVHRLTTPDGRTFEFETNKKEELPHDGGVTVNSSLATSTSSSFDSSVPQSSENVTTSEENNSNYAPNPEKFGKPITTVKERNAAKLENLKVQLEKKQKLAEESKIDRNNQIASEQEKIDKLKTEKENALKRFNDAIYKLEREYAAKKDVNTQAAEKIQRQIIEKQNARDKSQPEYDIKINKALAEIERLKRMRDNEQADAEKSINDMKARIDKMQSDEFKVAEQRITKHQEHRELMRGLMGDTSKWQDKKMGIQYSVNTFKRNLRDIVRDEHGRKDIARADAIYEELQGKYNHNEAILNRESNAIKKPFADMKINKYEDAYIQMLGEYRGNPDTTIRSDEMTEYYEKYKDKIDTVKVDKAIEMARRTYDNLFFKVNKALVEQGFKPIEYRKGYFPHFTEHQGKLAKLLNWKVQDNTIPTDIAGLTEMYQPERSWQSFDKHRTGDSTDFSFTKGLDTYVKGALDWIYHIDDIQKLRAFENEIRYQHSPQGVQDKIEEIMSNESFDTDEAQKQIDLVYENARNPLNNFVQELRRRANNLAGKKDTYDREMEGATNRHVYSVMTNVSNRISANMVAGSISSALTNFIPITQSWGEVSPRTTLKAMKDTVKSIIRDDGMIDKSDFMTNRLKSADNLNKSGWDKVGEVVGGMMEAVDYFTTQTVWRSKYIENVQKGMSEDAAIKNADDFAEGLMAGRSRGNMPTVFNAKNPVTKLLSAFQLEVANQYGYLFKDLPENVGKEAKDKLVKSYLSIFVGAYAYNALYSNLTGRDAALDPIRIIQDFLKDLFGDDDDEEGDTFKAVGGLMKNVAQEVPFVGGLLDGGRVPISSALPFDGSFSEFTTAIEEGNKDKLLKEMLNPVMYIGFPLGGGQIKKTYQGMKMFDDDLPIAGSYTDSGNLRFAVPDTAASKVQAALFGQWANENAQDYFDNSRQTLKSNQIQELVDLDLPMKDYWEYRDGLKDQKTLEDKFDYIAGLDLPVSKKNIMINNIVQREEEVDMSNYDDFSGYEEFDFYFNNQDKYEFLQKNNVSYEEYMKDEDSKSAYNWAYKNPDKYMVSQVISDDVVKYKSYMNDIKGLTGDKDKNGKTISGSRKDKVVNYINDLNIDYGAKMLLFKMEYPSDNTYNAEIVNYLNEREDVTYQDMVTILKELGFTVSSDDTVSW